MVMKEIERAISSGDYDPLQNFLLDQASLLNKTGMDFIKLSTTGGDKKGSINYCTPHSSRVSEDDGRY